MKEKLGVKRVAAQIKRVIADFLQHDLHDPRQGFTTVTRVELSQDYRQCVVYVSVLGGDGEKSKVMHMLESARGYAQRRIARALSTRVTPHLEFREDETLEKAMRVEAIFDKIAAERREQSGESDDEEEEDEDEDGDDEQDSDSDESDSDESDSDVSDSDESEDDSSGDENRAERD